MKRMLAALLSLLLLPCSLIPGFASEKREMADRVYFVQETVVAGASAHVRGILEQTESGELHIGYFHPGSHFFSLEGSAAQRVTDYLNGKQGSPVDGITVSHISDSPRTVWVTFPHGARVILTFGKEGWLDSKNRDTLYRAWFRDAKGEFACILHVTSRRVAVLLPNFLPMGWVSLKDGKPNGHVRVLPDTDADLLLQRAGTALTAGIVGRYEGDGWIFFTKLIRDEEE